VGPVAVGGAIDKGLKWEDVRRTTAPSVKSIPDCCIFPQVRLGRRLQKAIFFDPVSRNKSLMSGLKLKNVFSAERWREP
jgi:hypothetical protein